MTKNEILIEKYELICSKEYQKIKQYQLENIVRTANSDIEPLIFKGMLKVIADTDKWETEFINEKKKSEKE